MALLLRDAILLRQLGELLDLRFDPGLVAV
jgi:hypothetical protein